MKEKKSGQLLCKLKSKKRKQYHFNTDLDSEVKPKINSGGKDQERHGSSQRMTKPIRLQDLENSVASSQTEKKKNIHPAGKNNPARKENSSRPQPC